MSYNVSDFPVEFSQSSNICSKGSHTQQEIKTDPNWTDMKHSCINSMRTQIQSELRAAMQYLAMGAHFARDTVNRPGFAKMFFDAASEERQHAIKLISYLLMRGELISDVSTLIDNYVSVFLKFLQEKI